MALIRIFLVILSMYQSVAYSCDENIECPKCGEKSEFTWNSSNQFVSSKLSRFYDIEGLITSAYERGNYDLAKTLIKEYLELASIYRCNWNYGNAIHNSNRILGFIALKGNDISGAKSYLIEAGKSTGSPQLDSFGPNLDLANELLLLGESEVVVNYLLGVRKFWDGNELVIDEWIQKIKAGDEVQLNRYEPSLI